MPSLVGPAVRIYTPQFAQNWRALNIDASRRVSHAVRSAGRLAAHTMLIEGRDVHKHGGNLNIRSDFRREHV